MKKFFIKLFIIMGVVFLVVGCGGASQENDVVSTVTRESTIVAPTDNSGEASTAALSENSEETIAESASEPAHIRVCDAVSLAGIPRDVFPPSHAAHAPVLWLC